MKTVAFHNLGCKVNSYELEVMQQKLQDEGYTVVPFDSPADIYIINTCTVTNIADRKSRQMLHRAKQKNPQSVVVAVGCYVQSGKENAEKDESIDLLVGNNRKKDIVEILEDYLKRRGTQSENRDKTLGETTVLDINHTYEYEEMQLRRTSGHTRAYIKIQDGCNQFCSYCEIPYARGRVRSRKAEDILKEITVLAESGCKEVVLTGIHISSYGIDFDGQAWSEGRSQRMEGKEHPEYTGAGRLIDLVEKIQEIPGLERIRLGSLEPRIVTPATAKRLASVKGLCPHFHLSLQSGCDATLKRMNRHYTTGEYLEAVELLRENFNHPAITTDVIVGFPGETDEEFRETKAFLEKIGFYEMHIFKYSRRAGTAADRMPDQIPDSVKTIRSNELLAMEKRQSEAFRRTYIGREAEVLLEDIEEIDGRQWRIGHTPDYVRVAVNPEGTAENTIVRVPVKGLLTEEILVSLEF